MKVYAEYYKKKGITYRRKTLLQFGKGTNLIGSAILINPGSSKPVGKANAGIITAFYTQNGFSKKIDTNIWHTFKPDPTMIQLEKIFNGWYLGNSVELDGIIQLFNCNYYKNPNLCKMNDKYDLIKTEIFDEYQFLLDRPVYFGWGSTGKKGRIRETALKIFSTYDLNLSPIYNSEFDENCFYHPGYINRSYKKNCKTKKLLVSFNRLFKIS